MTLLGLRVLRAITLLSLAGSLKASPQGNITSHIPSPSNSVGDSNVGSPKAPLQKCYIALKHNESQLNPTPHSVINGTGTVDDVNVISARLLTVDPKETTDRVVTLDNGGDCKIAVLIRVNECRFAPGMLPERWDPQKSPKFDYIFSPLIQRSRTTSTSTNEKALTKRDVLPSNGEPQALKHFAPPHHGKVSKTWPRSSSQRKHLKKRNDNPKSETLIEEPTEDQLITYEGSGCQSDYYVQLWGPSYQD